MMVKILAHFNLCVASMQAVVAVCPVIFYSPVLLPSLKKKPSSTAINSPTAPIK